MRHRLSVACIVLFRTGNTPSLNPQPALPQIMVVQLRPFLSALGVLSASATLALAQTGPAPIAPPITPAAPAAPSPVPAPIEPPVADTAAPAPAATAIPAAAGIDPLAAPTSAGSPTASRTNEFQGDDITLVLRTLARQARMNIVVSDKVQGTVTLRLEDKTPREAIEVIVAAKGLVMDELNGVFFIKTTEERAKEPTEGASYTLSYAKAEDVSKLLRDQLASGIAPQFDARTNTVFYREGRSNLERIHLFLETIDRPTQQVMIEARLVEVTANPQQNYGINWAGVLGGASSPQTFRYGGSVPTQEGQPPTGVTFEDGTGRVSVGDFVQQGSRAITGGNQNPLTGLVSGFANSFAGQFAILSVPQMALTLRMMNEDADAEFLANPRVVTANNQKAEIKITRAQPVPQLNFNEQTAQAVFSGFQDKEFGNTLIVTPTINKDQFITLSVKPEISNKVGDAQFTFGGATVTSPIIDKRTLESNVLIKSGDTLAIGGLLQDEVSKIRSKVPVVGDIPVLGYLFQERRNARTKRNLLVFITPTVIQQGYGTGLESQVSGLHHSGEEFADPNGWRNNARGAARLVPTSNRQVAADYPKPGIAPAPVRKATRTTTRSR
jgi:type IV pilus secretin PilQ/predicted competence protein